MQYMGNKIWWNKRFKSRKLNVMSYEKYLEEDITYFKPRGKILDIACGDGRNSIYLARLGFEVVAIDFSEEALNRLTYFAKEEKLSIETKLIDLSSVDKLKSFGKFDGIIINHYRIKKEFYDDLMNCLNNNGILWVNGFREVPINNTNITNDDIFEANEFKILDKYKIVSKKLYEIGDRKFIRGIWSKI